MGYIIFIQVHRLNYVHIISGVYSSPLESLNFIVVDFLGI